MTANENSQLTRMLSESSTEQKAHLLGDLTRDLICKTPNGRPVPIRDSTGNLVAYILPIAFSSRMPEDENSEEFYSELRRRCEEEPTLTPEQFFELLRTSEYPQQ